MNNEQLQKLVEDISLKYFARPFTHRAYFNSRLRTTGGRYHVKTHDIDINPKMLTEHSMEVLVGVIKHELCHYHLHLAGYSGKHNTIAFKKMLKSVGGSRYAPAPVDNRYSWEYICSQCGQVYKRKRKINTRKYVCGKCRGKLKLRYGDD
ncbi:SprT family protein [Apilactobacillus bombintestini]|uniref:SprT family protein n=1 Tax=Apilactobacillus bombintestini TaxID=2419772 RepID=A0A387AW96_9LACO|nr:SprT family protein [Apilactobacillus bombintestini]AYF92916.1 SprT family protein [Apilactobacillus bombintestini]